MSPITTQNKKGASRPEHGGTLPEFFFKRFPKRILKTQRHSCILSGNKAMPMNGQRLIPTCPLRPVHESGIAERVRGTGMQRKINFTGLILSVQPRSNVWRYRLDNRTHTLTGYNLFLTGIADNEEASFSVAVSEKQQEKFRFSIGDQISGTAWTKKKVIVGNRVDKAYIIHLG